MKLTSQQWLILLILFLAFIVAIGVLASSKPNNVTEIKTLLLSTSTPKPHIFATGWWDVIPTDPSLPTMPNGGSPTATPPQTSVP